MLPKSFFMTLLMPRPPEKIVCEGDDNTHALGNIVSPSYFFY
jgi:hypothetical protein